MQSCVSPIDPAPSAQTWSMTMNAIPYRSIVLAGLLAGGLCAAPASAATNLLVNHSFEDIDAADPTYRGLDPAGNTANNAIAVQYSYNAEDGHYVVYAGAAGSDNYLSQTFTKSPATPTARADGCCPTGRHPMISA